MRLFRSLLHYYLNTSGFKLLNIADVISASNIDV